MDKSVLSYGYANKVFFLQRRSSYCKYSSAGCLELLYVSDEGRNQRQGQED